MRRCESLECGNIINERGSRFVRLAGKRFCSLACGKHWLTLQGLRVVSDKDKPKLPVVYGKLPT